MARCGCQGSGSGSSSIVGGAGINVTGSGSAVDPTIVAADCPETIGCVAAHLGQGLAYDSSGVVIAAKRSGDADNALVFGGDGGLKVPASSAGGVVVASSGTVTFTGTGKTGSPLIASVVPALYEKFPRGRVGGDTFQFTVSTTSLSYFVLTDKFSFPAGRRVRFGANIEFWASGNTALSAHCYVDTAVTVANTNWWYRNAPPGSLSDGVHEEIVTDLPVAGQRLVVMVARTMTAGVPIQVRGQIWAVDEGAIGFLGP